MSRIDLVLLTLVLALTGADVMVKRDNARRRQAAAERCAVVTDSATYRDCQCWRFAESTDSTHTQADCHR